MGQVGYETQGVTKTLTSKLAIGKAIIILDLCMAPGGFSPSALNWNSTVPVFVINLDPSRRVHEISVNIFMAPPSGESHIPG
jgi:23S rRNA U2552 (ribose-2'-O)-methylase RlmE/FtsJ